jgi:predicted transcriptional regulator of viral defense system
MQKRKLRTADFLAENPVFSLEEATAALAPPGGRSGTVERLKHYLETGRLERVTREIYAVVPRGTAAGELQPDPFLVAAAARPDGIFSHHSALELLGAAHSARRGSTLWSGGRNREVRVGSGRVLFLPHPTALRLTGQERLGTRTVEWRGKLLETTGPERTLVEGFRRPALAGGFEELVESAAGFSTLDLDLLERVLAAYDTRYLWAAAGWFLELHRRTFHVQSDVLRRFESKRPAAKHYLLRDARGGTLVGKWNLILPDVLTSVEPSEDQP